MMSLIVFFCAVIFTRDLLDEIWDSIPSVYEDFPTYCSIGVWDMRETMMVITAVSANSYCIYTCANKQIMNSTIYI